MTSEQILSWVVSAIGILGFYLAGKKIWWAWYVNIANQVFWTMYAFITQNWGFLLATAFYLVVFGRNAYLWTKNRNKKPEVEIPEIDFGDPIRVKRTNRILFLREVQEDIRYGASARFDSHPIDRENYNKIASGSVAKTDKK